MYEVRFLKDDGNETLILVTPMLAETEDVIRSAGKLDYQRAEIWYEGKCVRTVHHDLAQSLMPHAA